MTTENLPSYVRELRRYGPSYIEGYPSTLYILAKFMVETDQCLPLRAAFTSSETLHPIQGEIIEKAFQTTLYDFYGLAERVVFATECSEKIGKHLNLDYGITEIVDDNDDPVSTSKTGWIVGTGLHNYAMPLIRYKTDDISCVKDTGCSCGRTFPLMDNVTTKAEDIVTTPDGKFISSSVLTHPFKSLVNILESQIIQDDLHNIRIKIVRGQSYNDQDTDFLVAEMKGRIGERINLQIEFVDHIDRSANGKFRWVISNVPLKINDAP
jgi:phenylacetate-CoA ligase